MAEGRRPSIQCWSMAKGNPFEMKHTLKTEWILGIVGGVVTMAAIGLGRAFGKISHSSINEKLIVWAAALVLVVAGSFAIVHLSRAARALGRPTNLDRYGRERSPDHERVGYLILIFALLTVLGVSLDHLLIGAGVAGIILGVAAQQSLGNVFAAIVMLVARPFVVGDTIRIRSGVTGVLDVRVLGIGLTYVTVEPTTGCCACRTRFFLPPASDNFDPAPHRFLRETGASTQCSTRRPLPNPQHRRDSLLRSPSMPAPTPPVKRRHPGTPSSTPSSSGIARSSGTIALSERVASRSE